MLVEFLKIFTLLIDHGDGSPNIISLEVAHLILLYEAATALYVKDNSNMLQVPFRKYRIRTSPHEH